MKFFALSFLFLFIQNSHAENLKFTGEPAQNLMTTLQSAYSLSCQHKDCQIHVNKLICQYLDFNPQNTSKSCSAAVPTTNGSFTVLMVDHDKADEVRQTLIDLGFKENSYWAGSVLNRTISVGSIDCLYESNATTCVIETNE